jgi:HPt (histidine-containing phosphotransfer) domain-containing protein
VESHTADVLDKAALLDRLGGDLDLFHEITGLFQEDSSKLISEIRAAVSSRNPAALERAAHTLKGCVANFSATILYEAALHLEKMGRAGQLEGAADACLALESEIQRFQRALRALAQELAPN